MRRASTVLLLAAWSGVAAAQSAAEGVIRIDGTKSVRICGDCDARTVSFPVTRVDGKPLKIGRGCEPKIVEVSRDGTRVPSEEAGAFGVRWDAAPPSAPLALILSVAKTFRVQGTYTVVVSLLPRSTPAEPSETLQVTIPMAELDVPEKLILERTVSWPWRETPSWTVKQTPLSVREKGRLTSVERLEGDGAPFVAGLKPITGRVETGVARIGKDSRAGVEYWLTQDFPLGTATGSLLLRAPELKEPVKVAVEVRSRLSGLYLLLTIVLGFAMSWVVKVQLGKAIELRRVRAHAQKLLGTVASDRSRYKEGEFSDQLRTGESALLAAVTLKDATEIDRLRGELDALWRVAVQAAETRRTEFRGRAKGFFDLVSLDWVLPPQLHEPLVAARESASQTASVPPAPDLKQSVTALETAQKTFSAAVFGAGADWQRTSRATLNEILDRRHGLPETLVSSIAAAASAWREKFPLPDRQPRTFDAAAIEPALRAVGGEYLAFRDAIDVMITRLGRTLAAVLEELGPTRADALPQVTAATGAVKPVLQRLVDHPEEGEQALRALRTLQQAWEDELVVLAQGAPARGEVRRLVKEGKFSEAALAAAPGDRVLSTTAAGPLPTTLDRFSTSLLPLTGGGIPIALAAGPAAPYFALFLSSLRQLRLAKAAQTVILAVLFLIWAFGSYGAAWDGTWQGLRTVFFAAFAVDVAADALLTRLKTA